MAMQAEEASVGGDNLSTTKDQASSIVDVRGCQALHVTYHSTAMVICTVKNVLYSAEIICFWQVVGSPRCLLWLGMVVMFRGLLGQLDAIPCPNTKTKLAREIGLARGEAQEEYESDTHHLRKREQSCIEIGANAIRIGGRATAIARTDGKPDVDHHHHHRHHLLLLRGRTVDANKCRACSSFNICSLLVPASAAFDGKEGNGNGRCDEMTWECVMNFFGQAKQCGFHMHIGAAELRSRAEVMGGGVKDGSLWREC
uniref:Uncharacterized protein n=1 Tax=Musa acuminata TaxID=4641 RepID=Q1EPK9_MUSAC|nr:hypothetical protein MA4_25J11.10 [Musa acuminata]